MDDNQVNKLRDVDVLARTIYGEARGEYAKKRAGIDALMAVGCVVMNRYRAQTWFGKSIRDVCLKPYQFSCWNRSDPNYALIAPDQKSHLPYGSWTVLHDDAVFGICNDVARQLIFDHYVDVTHGADHYYATSLRQPPHWAAAGTFCRQIGAHRFYRLL